MALTTSAGAPWEWRSDTYTPDKPTLASGEPADEGGVSWLELKVRGPERLYFKSRIEMVPILFDWGNIYYVTDMVSRNETQGMPATMGIMPLASITIAANDSYPVQSAVNIRGRQGTASGSILLTDNFQLRPIAWTSLSLLLDGKEVALPSARTAGPSVSGSAECLGSSGYWMEHVLPIPAGRHTVRWQYTKRTNADRGGFLDGVRLEGGRALKVTQPRSFTFATGQAGSGKVRTNARTQRFTAEYLPPGLSLNAATGVLSGTALQPGVYESQVTARTARGDVDTVAVRIEVQADAGAALDEPRLAWTQGSDTMSYSPPCTTETTTTTDGIDALRINSGAWLETSISGPERLSFSWMASYYESEVEVLLDGTAAVLPLTSTIGWQKATLEIPAGRHRVRFQCPQSRQGNPFAIGLNPSLGFQGEYVTTSHFMLAAPDGLNYSPGMIQTWQPPGWGTALVDNVRLGSRPRPHLTTPGTITATAGSAFLRTIAVADAASITATGLPDGVTLRLSSDGQHAEWQGIPRTSGTYPMHLTATGPGGIAEVAATLFVAPPIGPALEAEGLVWRTDSAGGIAWRADEQPLPTEQNYLTWNGMDAVRTIWQNGSTSDDNAWIETDVTGPDTLHFRWLGNWSYASESVSVLLDGLPVKELTRSGAWQPVAIPIPAGSHTVRWQATSSAWGAVLDEVRLASDARAFIVEETAFSFTALRGGSKALQLSRPATVSVIGELPLGLTLSSEGTLSGRAARSGSWTVELNATTPGGTTTWPVTITVAPPCLPDWLAAHGLTGANLRSDTDGDRLPLLVEFVLGGDPSKPDYDLTPVLSFGEGFVSWQFPCGDYDEATVLARMEYSGDMKSGWAPLFCTKSTDAEGRPVHTGVLHGEFVSGRGFFRIRAEIHRPGVD